MAKHNAERVVALPDAEIAARYGAGETIAELAAAYGVSRPTLAKALGREGVQRRPAKQRPGRMCGEADPSWKGGRRRRSDGYWLVCTDEGDRLEHRVVMEKLIGRRLRNDEIVHHRDGNKGNNDPANLELMTQSEHARHHAPDMHAARYGYDR